MTLDIGMLRHVFPLDTKTQDYHLKSWTSTNYFSNSTRVYLTSGQFSQFIAPQIVHVTLNTINNVVPFSHAYTNLAQKGIKQTKGPCQDKCKSIPPTQIVKLHHLWYLVSLTIWSHIMQYLLHSRVQSLLEKKIKTLFRHYRAWMTFLGN
jgi:hypothetical protein